MMWSFRSKSLASALLFLVAGSLAAPVALPQEAQADDNDELLLRVNFQLKKEIVPTGIETKDTALLHIARGVVQKGLQHPLTPAGAAAPAAGACDPSTVQRVFRHAGKNEMKHLKAGLHLHMYIECSTAAGATALVDELNARRHEVSHSGRVPKARQIQYPNDPQTQVHYTGSPVDMASTWAIETGNPDVIVGITDSGMDMDHPCLLYTSDAADE